MSTPDLDQVQGNILTAFNTDYQTYLGFNLPAGADLVPVRSWIADLANVVTVHSQVKSERQAMKDGTNATPWVFAAFGHDLLRRLRRDVTFFSRPFRFGYASRRVFLGDHSDPSDWAFGANDTSRLDVLILLADNDSTRLHSFVETVQTGAEQVGLRPFWTECGVRLPGDKEVFGFTDGISQPQVQLGDEAILQPSETFKSGQFVLGAPNENGDLPSGLLSGDKQFSDGGSFLQIRRLQQDREAFETYCKSQADRLQPQWPDVTPQLVAAALVGRWPDGRLVDLQADTGATSNAEIDDFDFSDDFNGLKCPFGAHIRKVNPRNGASDQSLSGHQRFLRRGIPFDKGDSDRGLLFVAFQSDIEAQVDFVTTRWMNSPDLPGKGNDLLVSTAFQDGELNLSRQATQHRLTAERNSWIKPNGGAYMFAPSKAAIARFAIAPSLAVAISGAAIGRIRSGMSDLGATMRRMAGT